MSPPISDTQTLALTSLDGESIEADLGMAKKIGRHVVLEEVGRGGMGSVYRAYDPNLQREVALKRLRANALGPEGRARFEQEARAMAALSHPNVVAVYDVEALDGELVLVMEFVDGPTLRTWTRETVRPWHEILRPFLDAGRGLAAAHRAGLLHRDFKPANVLVTPTIAKVTDFGLAKRAKDPSGPSSTSGSNPRWDDVDDEDLTRAGEVMGTPRYMAPEQHRGRELTAAVDQFAFCVALWEALTRVPPYGGENIARKKSKGPPEWPSGAGPRWLGEALRRGLNPAPLERWPSMEALLAALSRDPKQRRRQALRGLAMVGLIATGGGAAYAMTTDDLSACSGSEQQLESAWGEDVRASVRAGMTSVDVAYADSLWQRTDKRLDEYATSWVTDHRDACEAAVRHEHSEALRDLRVACLDRGRVALNAITELLPYADVDILRNVDTMLDELPDLARCRDLSALQDSVDPPAADEADAVRDARDTLDKARFDRLAARFPSAEARQQLVEQQLAALDYPPLHGEYRLEHAELLLAQGHQLRAADEFRTALRLAIESRDNSRIAEAATGLLFVEGNGLNHPERALALSEVAEGAAAGDPALEAQVAMGVGLALSNDGQHEAGEQRVRKAIELMREANEPPQPRAAAHNTLGSVLRARGKHREAENEYRTAIELLTTSLGSEHPKVAIIRGNLASLLLDRGRFDAAEEEARAADAVRLRSLGPDHLLYGSGKTILAEILADARKFEEAERQARQGLEIVRAAVGRVHGKTANAVNALGRIAIRQGKAKEAEKAFREVVAIRTEVHGAGHPAVAGAQFNVAVSLRRQDRFEEAEAQYGVVREVLINALGPDHPRVAGVHNNLGVLYLDMGRYEDSKRESQRSVTIRSALMLDDDMALLESRSNLAAAHQELGEFDQAESELRRVLSGLEKTYESDTPQLAIARSRLADVLIDQGAPVEAEKLARQALEEVREGGLIEVERGRLLMSLVRATVAADSDPKALDTARTLAREALQLFVLSGLDGADEADETRTWLAAHPGSSAGASKGSK